MTPEFSQDDPNDESMVYEEISAVEEKCEQYVQSYRLGEAATVEEFAGEYPALESQILELLPTVLMMEDARQRNLGRRKDGRVNRGPEKIPDLGDFKIVRELGRGGMGIVYEAHQESLDRRVAIKLLPKHALKLNQIAKFCREAATAARLHHTNIAPVYGVGESNGFHFYAMQLLKGISLDQFVESDDDLVPHHAADSIQAAAAKQTLSMKDVVGIGRQVASALEYAHEQGVIHRDIKPSNLILDSDSTVWVTDFGLAVSVGNDELAGDDGGVSGTLRYMAPEKFSGAGDAPTEDIYSLGITLIELLSGVPAFESRRVKELTDDVQNGDIVALTHRGRSLPGDLQAVLKKAVAPNPAQRYQTAEEFEEDLRNFSEGLPVHATPHTISGTMWRWVKRNPALTVTSSLALSFLIAASDVSTVSYFKTQRALTAEHEQRIRAERASDLASRAMDRILGQFSTGSAVYDHSLESNPAPPRLTRESAAMLEELSDFYSQLATQNTEDTDLPLKALAARCRVGEINTKLGHNEEAAQSFQIAINGYRRLTRNGSIPDTVESAVRMAHLHNQLAVVTNNSGDAVRAASEHEKAIDLLNTKIAQSKPADERLLLELARTHCLVGYKTRPGMGPNSLPPPVAKTSGVESSATAFVAPNFDPERRASLEQAVELLKQIQVGPAKTGHAEIEKAASYLLSVCYRELANDIWTDRTEEDRHYQMLALESLQDLVAKHPLDTGYQFELMRTLAQINVFDTALRLESARATIDEAYTSLQKAVDIGTALTKAQPDVADYRIALIHTNFKLGTIAGLKSEFSESVEKENLWQEQEHCYRRALLSQAMLVRQYPQSDVYKVWQARFALSLAACESLKRRPENRNRLIGRAISGLNRLPPEILETPEVEAIMNEAKLISRQSLIETEL